MAMDWLKGLVGPTAQFGGDPGAAPGGWTSPYATPPQPPQAAPGGGPPIGGAPPPAPIPAPTPAAAWTPAATGGAPAPGWSPSPIGGVAAPPVPGADARAAALEARCAELQRDLESIALFARTLLTLLEEKQVVTQEQFHEARKKLDLLDGKLDDRIGKLA